MTGLLELREKLKLIYSKSEVFLIPILKFLIAFIALSMINGQLGYMTKLDNAAIVLIVALLCSFLPANCLILFAAAFSLLHMYALSMEVAVVGLCVYLVMFLLFFRFSPKDSLVVILTPVLCVMKIPYVMPIAMGLIGGPAAAVSIGCGVVVYYLFEVVIFNATSINAMGVEEATAKIRLIVDGMLSDKTMIVMIAAFAITVFVVYMLRRMAIDYSWTVAMVAGVMVNLVILLVGDLLYETNVSVLSAVLGSLLAIVIAKIIEFFRFCVDYSRTEKVQFEDDEYYYYVKAVPKMNVTAPDKTVKKINTQRRAPQNTGRRPGNEENRTRNVVTERTGVNRSSAQRNSANRNYGNDRMSSGKSVTINGNMDINGEGGDDFRTLD